MLQANQGRRVFADDGTFAFPPRVRRVWIDVGAHLLQTTGRQFLDHQDIGLIAIEPMSKPWAYWPRDDRLIGLPVAIYLDRGWRDFKIAAWEMASSLSDPAPDNPNMDKRRTVEVIQVPVIRLEDVMAKIPAHLPIEYVKVDVQGLDLQVIKSAGEALRRVGRVRAEVINEKSYVGIGEEKPATEDELVAYMDSMGFRFEKDLAVKEGRRWLDKLFINRNAVAYEP